MSRQVSGAEEIFFAVMDDGLQPALDKELRYKQYFHMSRRQ